jgi:hypothetical protein
MGPEPSLSAALRVTLTRPYGVLGGVLVVIVAMFWLARRVNQKPNPDVLPSDEAFGDVVRESVEALTT